MRNDTVETLLATDAADAERWDELVRAAPVPDVYYLLPYVQATAELEQSDPVAIVAGSDTCKFMAPLLVRNMSARMDGSTVEWKDACSPYGYGGLLNLSGRGGRADAYSLQRFVNGLHEWCLEQEAVCCVLRLHPLLHQDEWFLAPQFRQNFLRVRVRGSTNAINLRNWDAAEGRPKGMRKDRREDLNRARRVFRVTWKNGDEPDVESSLDLFSQIYGQALEQLHADEFYRFPRPYFSHLAGLGRHLGIAFVWREDEPVGANLFLAGWKYAHGHLAGTNDIGRKYGAATLLLVEGSRWAQQRGCELLHLGGGLIPGDTLESFKRSFGGPSYHYAYAIYVANPSRFEQLCRIPNPPWPYGIREYDEHGRLLKVE
jgi:Acetyltransferase (GNAT) domain